MNARSPRLPWTTELVSEPWPAWVVQVLDVALELAEPTCFIDDADWGL